jgi:hypothetical protein
MIFLDEDEVGLSLPHDDVLVVTMTMANHAVHRILVDNGSLVDILYWLVFEQMKIDRERIRSIQSPFVGFTEEKVQMAGMITLPVMARTTSKQAMTMVDFLVVDRPLAYNTIVGRPTLNKLRAITSTNCNAQGVK